MVLAATSTIIAVIVTIALIAMTSSICLYLYSQKSKELAAEEEQKRLENEDKSQDK